MHEHFDDMRCIQMNVRLWKIFASYQRRQHVLSVSDVEIIRAMQGDVDLSTPMSAFADL